LSLENLKKVIKRRMEERLATKNNELISEGYKLAKIL
jgi:Pyruvate/2-oxoacid:ferredoxin oxidoreductase gamma subunit